MILHLLTDEQFTDYAIQQFSAPEKESEFVLIPYNGTMDLVKLVDQCKIIYWNSAEFKELLNQLDKYTAIVFHGLFWPLWQVPVFQRAPKSTKIAWYFWGGEIYTRYGLDEFFLAPLTKKLYHIHNRKNRISPNNHRVVSLEYYKRIDYCLTSTAEEYEFAKDFTGSSFEHLWYTCYSLEETIGPLMDSRCEGNNIWLGNSAALENNHFDVLWKLMWSGALRKFNGEKVIIPLSYGTPWVKNLVKKLSRFLFGKRSQVLETYIPRNEYNSLMLSCSTMIIGYWEPAAQGNIITALWLGMRVYVSEKNMTYKLFKRLGAHIFSIESDLKQFGFTPLTEEERVANRKVLAKWYGRQHVMEAVQNVVNELSEPKKIND